MIRHTVYKAVCNPAASYRLAAEEAERDDGNGKK